MGTALADGIRAADRRVAALASRHPARSNSVAQRVGAQLVQTPQEAAACADVILLCVPDDAISGVAGELSDVQGKLIVHTAGARGLAALDVAAGRGALTGSIHPVMVVAGGGRGHHAFHGASAAIDGGCEEATSWLTSLATDLGFIPLTVPASHRALYHLSASLVGGLMTGLLASAVDLWGHLGLDRTEAARSLGRMVQEAGRNLEGLGVPHAVMGPAVRGDIGTMSQHIQVLSVDAPELIPLYRDLVQLCLPYALERGLLEQAQADAIASAIGQAD